MGSKLIHLKPENYVVSSWSGGTTTQIGIAPEGALYADRDFLWRLSSATVDLQQSDFTALPDYKRYIATLNGEIDIIHNDEAPIRLVPYQVHVFDGGWQTRSIGQCRDFNLMLRKGACDGLLESLQAAGESDVFLCAEAAAAQSASLVLYLCEGKATVEAEGEAFELLPGESVMVREAKGVNVHVSAAPGSIFMKAQAWK